MFIAFRLKPGRDDDLINWIQSKEEGDRSYHIRQVIRQGLLQQTPAISYPAIRIEPRQIEDIKQVVKEADLEAALDAWS